MTNHAVACRMSVLVVNLLQKIYVNQHERAWNVITPPPFKLLPKRRAEAATIRQTRQVISISLSS